jgi:glycerophosphoryl diester phosphodiesterase
MPDKSGQRLPFAITWAGEADGTGGILARAVGKNSQKLKGHLDNTGIYDLMWETLFK